MEILLYAFQNALPVQYIVLLERVRETSFDLSDLPSDPGAFLRLTT